MSPEEREAHEALWKELWRLRDRQHDLANAIQPISKLVLDTERIEGNLAGQGMKLVEIGVKLDNLLEKDRTQFGKVIAVMTLVTTVVIFLVELGFKVIVK